MPIRMLLPTPDPAIKPMRWPRPTGKPALIARIPVSSFSTIGDRRKGLIGGTYKGAEG